MTLDNSGNLGINNQNAEIILDINSTDGIRIPVGTTGQRPHMMI